MRITIPQDWDGEDWACVQIEWPNSPQWFAVLAGLISQVNRGWSWQETGGVGNDLPEVLAVAQEILARNWPWRDCEGEVIPPPSVQNGNGHDGMEFAGGGLFCWEDCMPCIDISGMLKIENGVLYALDHCCNWVAVGAISGNQSVETLDENPEYDPESDPPQAWAACGKAYGVITSMAAFINDCIDEWDTPPWEFRQAIVKKWPQWSLSLVWLFRLQQISATFVGLGSWSKGDITGADIVQTIICKLAAQLLDTPTVTDDEFGHLKSSISSALSDYYGEQELVGDLMWFIARDFWQTAQDAIGSGDLRNEMVLGASDTDAVCDCPDLLPPVPEGLDWFHTYDFTIDEQTFVDPGFTAEYVPGVGWRSGEYGGYDINLRTNGGGKPYSGSTVNGTLTFIRMTYSCDPYVSGARTNNVLLDGISPASSINQLQPSEGSGLVATWQGYVPYAVDNGETPSIRIEIVRDECGAGQYYGICHKLEIGGLGYDPVVGP